MHIHRVTDYWWKLGQTEETRNELFKIDKYPMDRELSNQIPEDMINFLRENTRMQRVLDFGCGMGSNFIALYKHFNEVYGYDTAPMLNGLIEHVKEIIKTNHTLKIPYLYSSFDEITAHKFDVIYDSTCWQHMDPKEIFSCLNKLSYKAPYAMSFTRSYNDFSQESTIKIITKTERWEVLKCSIPIEEALNLKDQTHYAVLYKSVDADKYI